MDQDFSDRTITLEQNIKKTILSQIVKDTLFLSSSMNTMDYSFLLGVHKRDATTKEDTTLHSRNEKYRYYIGIIDYLIEYDTAKKAENILKSTISVGEEVSSVDPSSYAHRMNQFLSKRIISGNKKTNK